MLRQARRQGERSWRSVLAAYRSPTKDRAEQVRLVLGLDADGLGKLAARLVKERDHGRYHEAVALVFDRWAELDPLAALALAKTLTPPHRAQAVEAALDGFAERRPADACAYLEAAADQGQDGLREALSPAWRSQRLTAAVNKWAKQDPVAAAAFYDRAGAGVQAYVTRDIAEAWTGQDPTAAMRWAAGLPEKSRQAALAGGLQAWAQKDPAAALQYYNAVTDPKVQQTLAYSLASGWVDADPRAAAQWVVGLESRERDTQPVRTVLVSWTMNDPAAATTWATGLASEPERTAAWPPIVQEMALADPAGAERWLATLPAGAARDAAAYTYCVTGGGAPFAARLDWAGRIGDAASRETATVKVLTEWLAGQPQAARQWINQANLPPAILAQINKPPSP